MGRRKWVASRGVPTQTALTRAESAELSRRRILDAAEELFAKHGYAATSTARIAERAKVPKGLLFYYFARKIDILRTLIEERGGTRLPDLSAGIVVPGEVAQTLIRLGEEILRYRQRYRKINLIVLREAETHEEVQSCLKQMYESLRVQVRAAIDAALAGCADPLPSPERRDDAATAFTALLGHAHHLRRWKGHEADLSGVALLLEAGMFAPGVAV